MKERGRQLRRFFIGRSLLGFLLAATLTNLPAQTITATQHAPLSHPSIKGITGDIIFAQLLEHNRLRQARLQQYSVSRTYRITNDKGKVRAETQVLMQYHAPSTKEFQAVSEKGSGFIRRHVFNRLMESEVETAAGRNRHDSSITPANYTFKLLGEEDVDGYHCFAVEAIPKRNDKYLFRGKVWIHATDFAVVKIAGQPAKNPSFWIKRVEFVRRYQKVGDFWLPLQDQSTTQVRIFGAHILTIDYDQYQIAQADRVDNTYSADSGHK